MASPTYDNFLDSQTVEALDLPTLRSKVLHAAHALDKCLISEMPPESDYVRNYENYLAILFKEWQRRSLPIDDAMRWAEEIRGALQKAKKGEAIERSGETAPVYDAQAVKDLWKIIEARRSVRNYLDRPVPTEILEKLVSAATWAPSSGNRQTLRYLVINDRPTIEKLGKIKERFVGRAPAIIWIFADFKSYKEKELLYTPYIDAGAAAENLLLLAHAMGLGAVMTKYSIEEVRQWGEKYTSLASELGVPDTWIPMILIPLGYRNYNPRVPFRRPLEEVIRWDRFEEKDREGERSAGLLHSLTFYLHRLKLPHGRILLLARYFIPLYEAARFLGGVTASLYARARKAFNAAAGR